MMDHDDTADRGWLGQVTRFAQTLDRVRRPRPGVSAPTPFDVVARGRGWTLRHYAATRSDAPRQRPPVLLVPPLIARALVFDLHRDRSLVGTLVEAGFSVYVVDWGEPSHADRAVGLAEFVVDWLPAAIEETCTHADAEEVSLFGYCLGGLFCLWHTASHPNPRVRNLVMVASPVDANRMGIANWLARPIARELGAFGRRFGMNVQGWMSEIGFWLLAPAGNANKWLQLARRMDDDDYVDQFAAMRAWLADFTAFPRDAFFELASEHVGRNAGVRGRMRLRDREIDLERVDIPLLAFAGDRDNVVMPASVRALPEHVASSDVTVRVAPGGHAAVMAGAAAPEAVWAPSIEWLAAHGA